MGNIATKKTPVGMFIVSFQHWLKVGEPAGLGGNSRRWARKRWPSKDFDFHMEVWRPVRLDCWIMALCCVSLDDIAPPRMLPLRKRRVTHLLGLNVFDLSEELVYQNYQNDGFLKLLSSSIKYDGHTYVMDCVRLSIEWC